MNKQDIIKLLNIGENFEIEFKSAEGGLPESLWETYSAFANTNGGVIVLGAKEKNKIVTITEINISKRLDDFWNIINNPKKVSANILFENDVQVVEVDGQKVIAINVPRANRKDKPIYINNNPITDTYRRNHAGDYKCTQEQINMMYNDKLDLSIDSKIVESLKFEDLNQDTVKAYRNRFASLKPKSRWNDYTDKEFLYRISAMGKSKETNDLHPTIAGLLMFGNEREITEEFSNYFLDYRDKSEDSERWIDRVTSQEGDDGGNIYKFYYKVAGKLTSDLKVPFALDKDMTRIDDTEAHKAIREALANSLIHANYNGRRGVVIEKAKDSIIISNPGILRIPIDEAMQGGVSDPRNPNILKIFSFINVGERAGSGLENIEMVCKEQGWEGPILKEEFEVERTILTIKTKSSDKVAISSDKVAIKNQSHQEKILEFLNENEKITPKQAQELLGLSEAGTRKVLSKMIDNNDIDPVGKNRGRYYILKA